MNTQSISPETITYQELEDCANRAPSSHAKPIFIALGAITLLLGANLVPDHKSF